MLLEATLVAAALYVCPGDIYTDQPSQGCQLLENSSKGGVSRTPERPEFDSPLPAPAAPDAGRRAGATQPRLPAASDQECAMYQEWITLSTKTSSLGARNLSPGEFQRWTNLKLVFANNPPPNCR